MARDSLGAASPFDPVLQHLRLFWSMRPWLQATRTFIFWRLPVHITMSMFYWPSNFQRALKGLLKSIGLCAARRWSFRNFVCFVHQTMQHRHEEDVSGFTTIPMVVSLHINSHDWCTLYLLLKPHILQTLFVLWQFLHRKEKLSNLALPFAISALFTGILIWLAGWLATAGSDAWPSTKRWSTGKCNGKLQGMNRSVDISWHQRKQFDWNSCAG